MDKIVAAQAQERRTIRRTTVRERCAYTASRREAHRERDAERFRFAGELAATSTLRIPFEQGFLRVAPGPLDALTAPVLAAGNALIDSLDVRALTNQGGKGDFIARGFLPESARSLDSPYFRLALDERIVGPVAAYLGVVPVVTELDLWYSMYHEREHRSSQLWHMDPEDTTQIKIWVHLNDVTAASGPLTGLRADDSLALADAVGYNYGDGYRMPDDHITAAIRPEQLVAFDGPAGSMDFIDTSRCFHFGSRLRPDGTPRRMLMVQYMTPYAFQFANHRKESPYRAMVTDTSTPLVRLLLGAA